MLSQIDTQYMAHLPEQKYRGVSCATGSFRVVCSTEQDSCLHGIVLVIIRSEFRVLSSIEQGTLRNRTRKCSRLRQGSRLEALCVYYTELRPLAKLS